MMRFGMMYKQGDIILIRMPFSDLSNSKQRPVLVISNDNYKNKTEDIVIAAITSKLRGPEYSVRIDTKDLIEGELRVTSEIRVDKIYTLSKRIVRKKFGQVNVAVIETVREKI